MNLKTIGDITSMMVIYLLLYSAQFQSLPDSFRIITLHYSWLRSSDEYDDTKECGLKNNKPHRTCSCLQKQNILRNQYILWVIWIYRQLPADFFLSLFLLLKRGEKKRESLINLYFRSVKYALKEVSLISIQLNMHQINFQAITTLPIVCRSSSLHASLGE